MSGVSPDMLCGLTSIKSRHSPLGMVGFFVAGAGVSISDQRTMQSQIVIPLNLHLVGQFQVRQCVIRAQGWREDEKIRQTLSPAIVTTPQSWGYHIRRMERRDVSRIVATPQTWGYHIIQREVYQATLLSLPRKSGGITSISSAEVWFSALSLPRKSGGITSQNPARKQESMLSLPRKSGGITSPVFSGKPKGWLSLPRKSGGITSFSRRSQCRQ